MSSKRGQLSTELLIIIGLMLLLLVPLLYYAYNRANIAKEDIGIQKAEFAAERLARLADSVGYLGGASMIIDEIEIPPGVKSVSISGNKHDIVFEMDTSTGTKQIVKSSAFSIRDAGVGTIKREGSYQVKIQALSDFEGEEQIEMGLE